MLQDTERRPAAVVLAIAPIPPHGVIFVERSTEMRDHPGQIGLPGGGMDAQDDGDLMRTALRELHEEVGVDPRGVEIVGKLPIVRARVNRYAVTPFVAVAHYGELRIDANETVGAFIVPLAVILEELRDGSVTVGTLEIETPVLDVGTRRIWGLTGHILRSFIEEWHTPKSELRAEIETRLDI